MDLKSGHKLQNICQEELESNAEKDGITTLTPRSRRLVGAMMKSGFFTYSIKGMVINGPKSQKS
jgi:hypothetical protein